MLRDKLQSLSVFNGDERALSNVLGAAAMIGLMLVIVGGIAAATLGGGGVANLGGASAPSVSLVKADTEADPSGDYVNINHEAGPRIEADNIRIVIKDESGATLMNFESESDAELQVGDTIKINSTSSETTVRWGSSTSAYSSVSETFDLENEEIEIVFIHVDSNSKLTSITARA